MIDKQLVEKLTAWVEANPEAANTPFINVSTQEEYTVAGLASKLRAVEAGEAELNESLQSELNQIENWIGGL